MIPLFLEEALLIQERSLQGASSGRAHSVPLGLRLARGSERAATRNPGVGSRRRSRRGAAAEGGRAVCREDQFFFGQHKVFGDAAERSRGTGGSSAHSGRARYGHDLGHPRGEACSPAGEAGRAAGKLVTSTNYGPPAARRQ